MTDGMSSSSDLQPSMSGQRCFASLNLFDGKVYIASMNMRGEWVMVMLLLQLLLVLLLKNIFRYFYIYPFLLLIVK